MKTTRNILFVFVLAMLVVASCAPAATPVPTAAVTPIPTNTAWSPNGKIVKATDLNGKLVQLVSWKKDESSCCEDWVNVQAYIEDTQTENVWVKVLTISYHHAVHGNFLTFYDSDVVNPENSSIEYTEGKFDDDMWGTWQTNKYLGDDSIEVWDNTVALNEMDERVYAYWSDFAPMVDASNQYVVNGLLDESPSRVANVMLQYWWLTEWSWAGYEEVYKLVNGYSPDPNSTQTYMGYYGMVVKPSDASSVITFTKLPPVAETLGCLPKESIKSFEDWQKISLGNLELLIDNFYVADAGVLTFENTGITEKVVLNGLSRYIGVTDNVEWPIDRSPLDRQNPPAVTMPSMTVYEICEK